MEKEIKKAIEKVTKRGPGRPRGTSNTISVGFVLDNKMKACLTDVANRFEEDFGVRLTHSQAAQMLLKSVFDTKKE